MADHETLKGKKEFIVRLPDGTFMFLQCLTIDDRSDPDQGFRGCRWLNEEICEFIDAWNTTPTCVNRGTKIDEFYKALRV